MQCYFLLMATLQAAVILWLHHRTLRRNLQSLRYHLSSKPSLADGGATWVEASAHTPLPSCMRGTGTGGIQFSSVCAVR